MSSFPTAYPPDKGSYKASPIANRFVRSAEFAHVVKRRVCPGTPRWGFKAGWYDDLTLIATVWSFVRQCLLGQEFTWWDPLGDTYWYDLFIGYGDGSTVTFELPGTVTDSEGFKIDGVLQDPGDVTVNSGAGTDSRDTVTFDVTVTPGAGDAVTASFRGTRAWYVMITAYSEQTPELQQLEVSMESVR